MKNLYSPYNGDSFEGFIKLRLIFIAVLAAITLVLLLVLTDLSFSYILPIIFLLFVLLIIVISIFSYIQIGNYVKDAFSTLHNQTEAISHGNFDKRITKITSNNEFAKIAWQINDVTDQFEAFMKEIDTSTQYASEHKFYRKL